MWAEEGAVERRIVRSREGTRWQVSAGAVWAVVSRGRNGLVSMGAQRCEFGRVGEDRRLGDRVLWFGHIAVISGWDTRVSSVNIAVFSS